MAKQFICMKWGRKYGGEYVNRLYDSIARNSSTPFELTCFTDDGSGLHEQIKVQPLPDSGLNEDAMDAKKGGDTWRKVALFMPSLAPIEGDILYLDLDVVITGPLDRFFDYEPGHFCVIHDWLEKRRGNESGNTSIVRFNLEKHQEIYHYYGKNQEEMLKRFRIEQQYVSWAAKEQCGSCKFWPSEWVESFKRSCRPVFPCNLFQEPKKPGTDCSVLVFHGYPTPEEAIEGYRAGPIKTCKPATWLKGYWNPEV
ncbi:MAG: glycosyl transferase [Akkermansiaceae bacterium]